MKAMILAAGRGTRMGVLSNTTPKPLLQVNGKALIEYHLYRLAEVGVHDIVINISHHADQIRDTLGTGERYGVSIQYSHEASPLETAGGIYQALPLLGKVPFLVVNGDIFTDYPFQLLLKGCARLAHLVLVNNPPHHPRGDFALQAGELLLEGDPQYTYAGIGVYHPDFFKHCPLGSSPLRPLILQHLTDRQITAEHYAGLWYDVGTPERLAEVALIKP